MSFNLTWHMSAAQSNLTGLQAGDLNRRIRKDRRFGKTRWRGCQPPQIRFGRGTEEMKPEDEP